MSELLASRGDSDAREITLLRGDRGNALNPELVTALDEALQQAAADKVALVVLRGEGKHFCTGIDLSAIETLDDQQLLARFVAIEQLLARVWSAPFLTVAVGQGRAMGAGADLFAACDWRIAMQGSGYAFPGAAFGLVLGTRRLAARVGPDCAMRLVLSGRLVDSVEACDLGLASGLADEDGVSAQLDEARVAATRCPSGTIAAIRRAAYADQADVSGDLAALTASAGRPGLRDRIIAYRDHQQAQRARNGG